MHNNPVGLEEAILPQIKRREIMKRRERRSVEEKIFDVDKNRMQVCLYRKQ